MFKLEGGIARTVLPQLPNTVLTTNVPDGKVHILVLDCLYVETYIEGESDSILRRCGLTNCGYGRDYLSQPQLVETTNRSGEYQEAG
jgi:hypothetical protein